MKRALLTALFATVLCLAFAQSALAVGITGTVKDINTGAPIPGAAVIDGGASAVTDASGAYTLAAAPGDYTLSAAKAGYLTTYQICTVSAGSSARVDWFLTTAYPAKPVPAKKITVLAWNDLGMHCDQDSYKYFMVLPPFNTLHAQVFGGEDAAKYTISYSFAKKQDSTLHTDFWTYASSFGYNLPKNVGLTGNGLSGQMKLENAQTGLFTASGIPVTPYDDDGTWDPYGQATLVVKDVAGTVVATTNVVVPVSTEMSCSNCHGTANPAVDILTKHDASNGTSLLADANAGHPHSCSECHSDNALAAPGKAGVESLSYAMHKRHDGKVSSDTDGCYTCHPGPKTECMRGIMARAGKGCVDCHGTTTTLWTSVDAGRKPWLDEPKCSQCHDAAHGENAGTLYRNSVLKNSVAGDMNGKIYCEACHNGTHAEYATNNPADAVITQTYQGDNYWIYNCQICHKGSDSETAFSGQAMHRGATAGGGGTESHTVAGFIDSATPNHPAVGQPVSFSGHATDSLGHSAIGYQWLDGATPISTAASFSTTSLTAGVHTIHFRVQCSSGIWSPDVIASITVASSQVGNVYRFRNLKNGYYLWTADENEKTAIINTLSSTWNYEGVAYRINTANPLNSSPLWRFRSVLGGFYLFSADASEKSTIIATLSRTWAYEGFAYSV